MVEQKGTGWQALLETQGLHQEAHILDNYGIGSATDVSELEKSDFIELEIRGMNPFQLKKLRRWCAAGGVTEMLLPRQQSCCGTDQLRFQIRTLSLRH